MTIRFFIPGPPQGKQRARAGNGHHYTPAQTREYEATVALLARVARSTAGMSEPRANPVIMRINAWLPIPKSWSKTRREDAEGSWATCKPDWDNIGKIVCDACNGILYMDDKQVVAANVLKRYSADPRVQVEVEM